MRGRGPAQYVRRVRLQGQPAAGGYPFTLPAVAWLAASAGLPLPAGVTFLVGENGSGKSTLVEALAVACGYNPEGGSINFRFATRPTESALGDYLVLTRTPLKPRTGFFLRAESYYNVASEIERLDRESPYPLLPSYGGVSPHERSHGESFVDLLMHRFGPDGLYLLDEPEAALSPRGCMAVLARLAELAEQNCQIIVATHSPILLALPGATIYEIAESGEVMSVDYDEATPVVLTREFLADPPRLLRYLLED